jgi:hypothetical protein
VLTSVLADGTVQAPTVKAGVLSGSRLRLDNSQATNSPVPLVITAAPNQVSNLAEWRAADGTLLTHLNLGAEWTTRHINIDTVAQGQSFAPELHYKGANGKWLSGIDWVAPIPARDFVVVNKIDWPNPGNAYDLIYCSHNGATSPTVGIGYTQPGPEYRLQVMSEPSEPAMGGLLVRTVAGQTGKAFVVRYAYSSNPPVDFFAINADGSLAMQNVARQTTFSVGTDGRILGAQARADSVNNRPLRMTRADGGGYIDFVYTPDGYFSFINSWTGNMSWQVGANGRFKPTQVIDAAKSGIQLPYTGTTPPSGGSSGEIRVGSDRLWVNANGTWRSIRFD